MKDIFVSYAREDRDWVEQFVAVLKAQDISVWWDRTIPPGRTWDEVIEEALDGAKCVVVVWSRTSVKSKWVKTEAAEGQRRGILFPVFVDDSMAPLAFRRIQGAQLAGWKGSPEDADFRLLVRSLRGVIEGQPIDPQTSGAVKPPERRPPPPDEPRKAPAPLPEGAADRPGGSGNVVRFTVGLVITLALVAFLLWFLKEPAFDPGALRVGLLIKDNWVDREAQQVYGSFLGHLNARLDGTGLAVDEELRIFRRPDEIVGALATGEIELAGELSPRGVHQAAAQAGAEPFVSPQYGGNHTYTSVFFVSRGYVDRQGLDPSARQDIWNQVVDDLSRADGNASAVVSDESSTSGYWYPRYELIRALRGSKSFDAVSIVRSSYQDLYAAVENGYNGAIVGAIAAFRFCDPRYVRQDTREACAGAFVRLDDTSQIPQGGFVLGSALHADLRSRGLVQRLQIAWRASVSLTLQDPTAADRDLARKYLPGSWAGVSNEDYAKAREVFEVQDAAAVRAGRMNRRLVFTGVAIILLVSATVLWLRRPAASQEAG